MNGDGLVQAVIAAAPKFGFDTRDAPWGGFGLDDNGPEPVALTAGYRYPAGRPVSRQDYFNAAGGRHVLVLAREDTPGGNLLVQPLLDAIQEVTGHALTADTGRRFRVYVGGEQQWFRELVNPDGKLAGYITSNDTFVTTLPPGAERQENHGGVTWRTHNMPPARFGWLISIPPDVPDRAPDDVMSVIRNDLITGRWKKGRSVGEEAPTPQNLFVGARVETHTRHGVAPAYQQWYAASYYGPRYKDTLMHCGYCSDGKYRTTNLQPYSEG